MFKAFHGTSNLLTLFPLQSTLNSLDAGMRDSLNEVASKALKKIISQPDTGDRDIDDTFLV